MKPLPEIEVEGRYVERVIAEHVPFNVVGRPPGNLIRRARVIEAERIARANGESADYIDAIRTHANAESLQYEIADASHAFRYGAIAALLIVALLLVADWVDAWLESVL